MPEIKPSDEARRSASGEGKILHERYCRMMRRPYILGIVFSAILALGVVAISAFADNTVWLCGEATINGTGNNRCLTVSENLEVQLFEDRGAIAASRVECAVGAVTDEGWVGPGSEDETTSVKIAVASCKSAAKALNLKEEEVENKCGTLQKIAVAGLPWKTLIELVAGVAWDKLLTAGAGWALTCSGITDTCTFQTGHEPSFLLGNLALEGAEFPLVDRRFPATEFETRGEHSMEFAKCSLGGAEEGTVLGEDLLAALTAGGAFQTLEVSACVREGCAAGVKVTPKSENYGKVKTGIAKGAVFTYTNEGPLGWQPTEFKFAKIEGEIAAWKVKLGTIPCNKVVPVGGTCEEIIEFAPQKVEKIKAILTTNPVSEAAVVEGEGE